MSEANTNGHGPSQPKKLSKIDLKRMEIRAQRRQRLIGQGVPPDQVEELMAREDYEALPIEKKLERVHAAANASMRRLGLEMQNLHHNDQILADSMDVNFRALAKMLAELGVSEEKQKEAIEKAREDIKSELEAREQAMAAAAEKARNDKLEETARKAGDPLPPPEEATVFGGD